MQFGPGRPARHHRASPSAFHRDLPCFPQSEPFKGRPAHTPADACGTAGHTPAGCPAWKAARAGGIRRGQRVRPFRSPGMHEVRIDVSNPRPQQRALPPPGVQQAQAPGREKAVKRLTAPADRLFRHPLPDDHQPVNLEFCLLRERLRKLRQPCRVVAARSKSLQARDDMQRKPC